MYASDWYMILSTGLAPQYLKEMDKKLCQKVLSGNARADLLGANAVRHFEWGKSGLRNKLQSDYYQEKYVNLGRPIPEWFRRTQAIS